MSLTYYITFLIYPSHCDYKVTRSVKKKGIIPSSALRSAMEKSSHRLEEADYAGQSKSTFSSLVKYSHLLKNIAGFFHLYFCYEIILAFNLFLAMFWPLQSKLFCWVYISAIQKKSRFLDNICGQNLLLIWYESVKQFQTEIQDMRDTTS